MQTEKASQQSIGWLVSGLVLGVLGVLVSVITPSWDGSGDSGVVALVNDTAITRAKYLSYLEALATDKKDPIGAEDSQYVLQRIIEEELLVQRGVEVGLLESDKRTRAALVNGMISMTTTAAEAKAPSEKSLAEFFQQNIDYFTPTSRLRARQLIVRGEDAEQRAGEAYRLLVAGERFQTVESEFGAAVALIVPDSLLPPAKLREYLGPTLTQMLVEQPAGFVTQPQAMSDGFRIVLLLDKVVGQAPSMADIREQLEAEYVRRSGDRALREYLDWLKDRADISYPSELPL
jgi:hypothetical protein